MWCDKCKFSTPNPPERIEVVICEELGKYQPSLVRILISKNDIEMWKKEGKNPDEEINRLKEERKKEILEMFRQLKSYYPKVLWCTKRETFVCCNPSRPTSYTDMSRTCKYFKLKV